MKNISYISLLLLIINFSACKNGSEETASTQEEQLPEGQVSLTIDQINNANIKTGYLKKDTLSEVISANGLITLPPNDRASINALFESFIDNIHVMEGDNVRKGDLLVSLKHPNFIQLQQEYQQAESQYNFLLKEVERQKVLSDSNVTAEKQYQKVKSDFESVRSQKNALSEKLELIGINTKRVSDGKIQSVVYLRAPFSGVVTKVTGYKGQSILPQQPIMEVINNSHTYLELNVFESNIGKIAVGQKICFRVSSFQNDSTYTGTVSSVGSDLDLNKRTITVNGEFTAQPRLIPGLYVEAEIYASPKPVMTLPEQAILLDQDTSYVFVQLENNADSSSNEITYQKTKVTTGLRSRSLVQITENSELSSTTPIVNQGVIYLKSEMNKGEGDDD